MPDAAPDAAPGLRAPSSSPLRFGPSGRFELQPAERRLLVDGQPAALGARALDLLITLAARPDHLMSKGELLDRVWPGLVVEEANLQMQISNLRKLLGGDVIATVPGRGYRFTAALDAGAAAALPAPAPPPPRAQRLFGRDADLARLEDLLQGGGCVTLVGTPGVGKTSLARAAAARRAGRCAWVDLAPLAPGSPVAQTLARALELQLAGDGSDAQAMPQLLRLLQGQSLLLVLDNAEHLIQTCAELATLLQTLPGLQLLVTSQLPLAVAGERVLRLEPLALHGAEAGPDDGALALLTERIVAADHRFAATPGTLPLLRAICAQLDGLPLALEMAAARVPTLGLQGVHDALAQRFSLLTRGHRDAAAGHRSLHNALDWSYRLLDAAEQRLFRALGVFAGGFTLELAVALLGNGRDDEQRWQLIDGLATLAERSLLVVSAGDPPRYRLLETMRAFALEQLGRSAAPADETDAMRRRHAGAVLALFAGHVPGHAAAEALCLAEMENAREAIAWAQAHELLLAAQLTAAVTGLTTFTSWRQESGNWLLALESAMLQPAGQALPAEIQAIWWTERARTAAIRRESNASVAARRAVALWRPLQQPGELLRATLTWVRSIAGAGPELDRACADLQQQAAALPDLSARARMGVQGALVRAAVLRGDRAAVLAGRQTELALAQEAGDRNAMDAVESNIVNTLVGLGRHAEAAERGCVLLERVDRDGSGSNGNLPWVFSGLIDALVMLGRLDEAQALVPRACAAGRRFGTPTLAPVLVLLAVARQRFRAGARLVGHARQSYASRGIQFEPVEEASLAQMLATAGAALGAAEVERLVREGRSLSDDAAAALAAGDEP